MAKQKHESGHVCKTNCCCDWSPHNQHVLWTVLMLLLIIFAGSVAAYLYQERDSFDNEIARGMMGNEGKVISKALKSAKDQSSAMMAGTKTDQLVWLESGSFPFQIQYPFGWHVNVDYTDRDGQTFFSAALNRKPNVNRDGGNSPAPTIELVERDFSKSRTLEDVIAADTVHLKDVKRETISLLEDGSPIVKVTGQYKEASQGPNPMPTTLYFFSHRETRDDGDTRNLVSYAVMASVPPQQSSSTVYIESASDQAILEQILKTVDVDWGY